MKIEAIIFDLDGTLADTIPLTVHSLRETAQCYTGHTYSDEEILREFGPIDTDIVYKLTGVRESVDAYVEHFEKNFHTFIQPIPGMNELLQGIRNKSIKTGIFTGRSERVTRVILKELGLEQYFDEIIPGDMTTRCKPDPEGILIMLERLQVPATHALYVGDFGVDIEASKAAGTRAILALWSTTASPALWQHQPEQGFSTTEEFAHWIDAQYE